tara:strand:- start:71 stop:259 length:189 start_codon:yes stop_codon:yes gene_type:complete
MKNNHTELKCKLQISQDKTLKYYQKYNELRSFILDLFSDNRNDLNKNDFLIYKNKFQLLEKE